MKIKGVIFDLDGTLGNTFPVIFPSYRAALANFTTRQFADEDIMALFGPSEEGVLQRLIPERWQEALQLYESIYRELSPKATQHFDGIKEVLEMLKKRGIALAVVTGKGINTAQLSLKELGLDSYFDAVEGGAPQGVIKPACMRKIIQQWGFHPSQVAYVGDAPSDMRDAKEVGAIPLGAAWYEKADAEALLQQKPEAVFRDLNSFRLWLEQHLNGSHP